tara:strand:+ start:485 stop:661 length:177 start_codon:yes stop_codon:yes gene_type:complete
MKEYKVYSKNDPQKETIFYVKGKNLEDATLKACEVKSLTPIDFLKIFGVKETKYETYD